MNSTLKPVLPLYETDLYVTKYTGDAPQLSLVLVYLKIAAQDVWIDYMKQISTKIEAELSNKKDSHVRAKHACILTNNVQYILDRFQVAIEEFSTYWSVKHMSISVKASAAAAEEVQVQQLQQQQQAEEEEKQQAEVAKIPIIKQIVKDLKAFANTIVQMLASWVSRQILQFG